MIVTIGCPADPTKQGADCDDVKKTAEALRNVINPLLEFSPDAVFIIVSNPG